MKKYITDANVIFSCLISGKEVYLKLFSEYKIYLPDFALLEVQLYQAEILKKTKLSVEQLKEYSLNLFDKITVVPNLLISTRNYMLAFELCKEVDEKDTSYVALTLELDATLLSKDEELIDGLRARGFQKAISLKEFFKEFEKP